jgi:hypothetical protein
MEINELPTPLFVRPAGKIPTFTVVEAARFLAKAEDDIPRLRNQLKGAAQRRLIHPRQREGAGPTSPALFGVDDIAVAVGVLFPLFDFGLKDADIASHASMACYHWHDTFNPQPSYIPDGVSPIAAALIGAGRGESWVFHLTDYYCDQTGRRQPVTTVYNLDAPPVHATLMLQPSFLSRVTVTIQLAPLLLPLTRVFGRAKADA